MRAARGIQGGVGWKLMCLVLFVVASAVNPRHGKGRVERVSSMEGWSDDIFVFARQGPISYETLPDIYINMPSSTGCSTGRCRVSASLTVPQLGPSKTSDEGHVLDVPLVILSPGFLVSKRMYFDYAERLASFGFAVLKWEPVGEEFPFWVDTHRTLAHFVQQMWLWAREKSQDSSSPLFQTFNASSGLMLVGHSRGAKINSLAAAWYPQDVRGIVNIDPVDSLPPFVRTNSQDYPSALPLMVGLSTPVLNVGSQLGNSSRLFSPPCAPSEGNYEAFFNHANRAWLLEILESGHMQFLGDDGEGGCIRCDMLRAACERGGQTDLLVRSLTMTAMTAWLSRCAGRPGEIGLYVMYWTELLKLQGLATSRYKEKMVGDNQSLDLAKEESGWQGKVEGTGLKRL